MFAPTNFHLLVLIELEDLLVVYFANSTWSVPVFITACKEVLGGRELVDKEEKVYFAVSITI